MFCVAFDLQHMSLNTLSIASDKWCSQLGTTQCCVRTDTRLWDINRTSLEQRFHSSTDNSLLYKRGSLCAHCFFVVKFGTGLGKSAQYHKPTTLPVLWWSYSQISQLMRVMRLFRRQDQFTCPFTHPVSSLAWLKLLDCTQEKISSTFSVGYEAR